MNLRNAHLAVVERHRVVDDLLNPAHPDNGGKAQFFESLEFSADLADLLIDALARWLGEGKSLKASSRPMARNMLSTARCRRKLKAAIAGWCGLSGSSTWGWKRLVW